jgi:hypothetical protein
MAIRCGDPNHYQTGNDSRNRAFISDRRSEGRKEELMGHGEWEQMLKDSLRVFMGRFADQDDGHEWTHHRESRL